MKLVERAVAWGTRKSPWVIHFNAGACNGCDIEVVDALTPRFDLERAGVLKQGSPRHADVLIVTGAVTLQVRDRLLQIYNQMPSPKFVVAVGACACTGGIFRDSYCVTGGVDAVLPVDIYVPGCAVRPEVLIGAITKLLDTLDEKEAAGRGKKKRGGKPKVAQKGGDAARREDDGKERQNDGTEAR